AGEVEGMKPALPRVQDEAASPVADARRDRAKPGRSRLAASLRRLTQAVWDRRSLRAQLLITFVAIDLVAALVAGGVTILRARSATRGEIAASANLAQAMGNQAVSLLRAGGPAGGAPAHLPSRRRFLGDGRMVVKDAAGRPIAHPASERADATRPDERSVAPAWFAALIAGPAAEIEVPVIVGPTRIGSVLVSGEPADEI